VRPLGVEVATGELAQDLDEVDSRGFRNLAGALELLNESGGRSAVKVMSPAD
jgi:hypothetical protein